MTTNNNQYLTTSDNNKNNKPTPTTTTIDIPTCRKGTMISEPDNKGNIAVFGGVSASLGGFVETYDGQLWWLKINNNNNKPWSVVTEIRGDWPSPRWKGSLNRLDDNRIILFGGSGPKPSALQSHQTNKKQTTKSELLSSTNTENTYESRISIKTSPQQTTTERGSKYYNDVWLWTSDNSNNNPSSHLQGTWTLIKTLGPIQPSPRRAHSTIMYKGNLVIFGGKDGSTLQTLNDLWVLKDAKEWVHLSHITFPGPARKGHSSTLVNDEMVIFGGRAGDTEYFGDVYVLDMSSSSSDFSSWKWRSIKTSNSNFIPVARNHHVAAAWPGKREMIIYSGRAGHDIKMYPPLNDVWVLNLETGMWREILPLADTSLPEFVSTPIPRIEAAVAEIKERGVLFFGGQDSNDNPLNDAWILELTSTTASWHEVAPLDCARVGYSVVVPAIELSLGFFLTVGIIFALFLRWRARGMRRGYEPL
jgi:hypothetical protein